MPFRGRLFFRIAVVLLLAVAALLLVLEATPYPSEMVRREMVRRIAALSGGRIEIASLDLGFFPPRLVARGVRFERDDPGGGGIRFACGEAELSLPCRVYLGRFDRIESLRLSRPVLFLKRGVAGGPAVAREAAGEGGGMAALSLGSLTVEGGSARVEDPAGGWEARLEEVELRGTGEGTARLEGSLDGGRFFLRKGDHAASGRAGAAFDVSGRRIAISAIRLDSGAGSFQAAGALDLDLSGPHPRFHLAGDASLEKPGAPRDLIGDLSGRMRLDLRGEDRPDGLHLAASIKAPDLAYRGWAARDLSLEALYQSGELRVPGLNAEVLGGRLSGQGSLRWKEGAIARARLEAQASLSDGSVDEISRLLGLPPLPVTGRLSHDGEYRMEAFDPATLEARGSVAFSGRLRDGARQAVTGSGRFRIAGSTLEVEEASLESSAASARFQGKIALSREGNVEGTLEADAGDLNVLAPFLARLPAAARTPLAEILRDSPGASVEMKGLLMKASGDLTLAGRAEARSLGLRGTRLGDLRAEFTASPSRVDVTEASLTGGDASLDVSGWLRLQPGAVASGDSFAVKGSATGMDLSWLEPWTGIPIPAEGRVAAAFTLSGRPEEVLGRVEWSLDRPVIASIPMESAAGRFSLVPGGLLLEEMRLSREGGRLEVSGSVGFGGAPILVYLNGDGIELGWLREAGLLTVEAEGRVRLQGVISGTLERPSAEIDLETPRLRIKEIGLGAISARFNADRWGGDLRICPEEKGIALTGRVEWERNLPFEADLDLEDFEVAASSVGGGLSGVDAGAVLSGSLHARGAFRDVSRLEVTGTLQRIALRLGREQIVSQTPTMFRWRRPRLEMTPLHLIGAGTDVALSGHLEPEAGAYLFTAEGEVALATLAPLWPGVTAGGTGAFRFSRVGSEAESRMEGWAGVSGGRLQGGGLPLPVSSLEGRLVLDPPAGFHLEGVSLVAGGGKMTLEGKGTLDGARVTGMDIALIGSDVLALAPKGFRGRYDLDLRLTQDASGRLLGGKINLIRGVYDEDFRLERSLLSLGREEPASMEEEETSEGPGFLQTVNLDLDLEASNGLWIINDFATLEGAADFHVGGTAAGPRITGRLSALEGGIIRFRQVRYRVQRGSIDLVDPERFNPYLDLLAETSVSDYQVNLRIEGSLDSFTYELTSSPPLTQGEIVALLVSGRSPNAALETGRMAQDVAAGYLTGGLASGLGGALQGVTGLDQFSIDPVYLTSQGDPASRVTVGKQITENLFAAYSTLLGSTSEEIYQLEYRISRDFKFSSVREADGSVGGDLRYILRLNTAQGRGPAASGARVVKIEEVRVEGEPGMPEEKLLRLFRVKPGNELDRARLAARTERVLRRYHRKDRWQATVETGEEPVEGGPEKVRLLLRVNAGPEVRIRLEGVPSRGRRKKEIESLWSGSVFPEETPEAARAKLERSLREEGYYRAAASVRMEVDTSSLRDAILTANPGVRTRVAKIEISGNESIETSRLESLLATSTIRRAVLRPDQVNTDAGRIRAHYVSLGYAQARVPPPEIEISEDGALATVRFRVVEGDPTRVAEVRIEGNSAIPSRDLLEGFPVQPNEPYTREKARAGAEALRRSYDREGYSRAKVDYELRGEAGPELIYRVEEGTRRLVGKIEIEGNRLTRKEVVERELVFREGKPLSAQEILESRKALYRLGIFGAVEIQEIEGENPERPTVRVQVAETRNLTQSLGIGYATDEGLRGLYDVTNSNLLGRARTVGLQLRGSDVNNRIQLLLRDPFLFNRRLDSLLSAFRERSVRDSFTLTETGSTLQVSNKHGEKDRTIYRYILKSDDVTDLKISPEEAGVESLRLSGLSGGYLHDSRDNFYNPRRGIFASADLAAYGQAIGSQAVFLKFFAQGSLFRKGPGDSVWAQSARLGLADPFGISDSLPLSERFFAGGDTTVRGFKFEQLGPKDPVTGEPTGGESLFIVNEEFRFPIWRFLRGVVFFDAGNVTSRLSEFDPLDLRTVLGAGIRIETPIGPIRFEYGWKLDREEGETPGALHITIGQAF